MGIRYKGTQCTGGQGTYGQVIWDKVQETMNQGDKVQLDKVQGNKLQEDKVQGTRYRGDKGQGSGG